MKFRFIDSTRSTYCAAYDQCECNSVCKVFEHGIDACFSLLCLTGIQVF